MSQFQKFYLKLISGKSDNNIDFNELSNFLTKLSFKERIKGSHHIFTKNGIEEIVNIQPNGKLAKIYQVKQIRKIIIEYKLGGSFE